MQTPTDTKLSSTDKVEDAKLQPDPVSTDLKTSNSDNYYYGGVNYLRPQLEAIKKAGFIRARPLSSVSEILTIYLPISKPGGDDEYFNGWNYLADAREDRLWSISAAKTDEYLWASKRLLDAEKELKKQLADKSIDPTKHLIFRRFNVKHPAFKHIGFDLFCVITMADIPTPEEAKKRHKIMNYTGEDVLVYSRNEKTIKCELKSEKKIPVTYTAGYSRNGKRGSGYPKRSARAKPTSLGVDPLHGIPIKYQHVSKMSIHVPPHEHIIVDLGTATILHKNGHFGRIYLVPNTDEDLVSGYLPGVTRVKALQLFGCLENTDRRLLIEDDDCED